jgi:hypothetical protein
MPERSLLRDSLLYTTSRANPLVIWPPIRVPTPSGFRSDTNRLDTNSLLPQPANHIGLTAPWRRHSGTTHDSRRLATRTILFGYDTGLPLILKRHSAPQGPHKAGSSHPAESTALAEIHSYLIDTRHLASALTRVNSTLVTHHPNTLSTHQQRQPAQQKTLCPVDCTHSLCLAPTIPPPGAWSAFRKAAEAALQSGSLLQVAIRQLIATRRLGGLHRSSRRYPSGRITLATRHARQPYRRLAFRWCYHAK